MQCLSIKPIQNLETYNPQRIINAPYPISDQYKASLLTNGIVKLPSLLNVNEASKLKTSLLSMENTLSRLDHYDLRWCKRYCKNMFYFDPNLRNVFQNIAEHLNGLFNSHHLYLMNDEISYNLWGEKHFTGWHLDTNSWQSLHPDTWAWTIYIPLDSGNNDQGGWLRFASKKDGKKFDEYFERGDVLVFDRWIWHRLVDFKHKRASRLAYILRVTNETRFKRIPFSPSHQIALWHQHPFPAGWQLNNYCINGKACLPSTFDTLKPILSTEFCMNVKEAKLLTRQEVALEPKYKNSSVALYNVLHGKWRKYVKF